MANATTIDEIEAATLAGLVGFADVKIAYTARHKDGVWTISDHVGLSGPFRAGRIRSIRRRPARRRDDLL
jgi:hypothetical protein